MAGFVFKMKKIFFIVTFCLFLLIPSSVFAQHAGTVNQYDIFELTYNYPTSSLTNPWEEVTVSAIFYSPSGKELAIDGFYYDTDTYKLRFSPAEVGNYSYTVTGTFSDTGSFVSIASSNEGFIRKDPSNPARLVVDGLFFNGIGLNDCWYESWGLAEYIGVDQKVDVDTYFRTYANAGFNLFRWNPFNCSFAIYQTPNNQVLTYDLGGGKLGDQLLATAKKQGFHVMFAFFYNIDFYNAEEQVIKKAIRYAIARYGAYTDIWELTNETGSQGPAGDQRLQSMTNYVRSLDPYQRLVTNSVPIPGDWNYLDVRSPHWYTNEIDSYPQIQNISNGIGVIVGEAGNWDMNWDPLSADRMRIKLWTAFFAGGSMIFWNTSLKQDCLCGNIYLGDQERGYIRILQNIVSLVDKDFTASSHLSSNPNVIIYVLKSAQTVLVYAFRNPGQTNSVTTSFDLNLPFAGTAAWTDPKTGMVWQNFAVTSGTRNFTTPSFSDDILLKITSAGHVDILDLRQLLSSFTGIFDYNLVVGNFGR